MQNIDVLKNKFEQLTEEEKITFMKEILPAFCGLFRENQEKVMQEIMPVCREMMSSMNMDKSMMMNMMMNMMQKPSE